MFALECLEVALGIIGVAGVIRGHFRDRKTIAELKSDNAKLFGMYTGVQEQIDKIGSLPMPPEIGEDGKPLPPCFPRKEMQPLNESQCPLCEHTLDVTYKYCSSCTIAINGTKYRIMFAHFHCACGKCKATYVQRGKS